jgi:endonuclease-3
MKKTAEILHNDYNDDIPDTIEGLLALPGVGIKMATITMSAAHNKITGIGVDTHVHRISNRLGWVKTKEPNVTQVELQKWVPRELWGKFLRVCVCVCVCVCVWWTVNMSES